MKQTNSSESVVLVGIERLAKLEQKVDGVESDVHEIRTDISSIKQDSFDNKIALTKIAVAIESMNDIKPRVERLEQFKYKAIGVISVFTILISIFGQDIRNLFLG
ncbi:hypothetical protein vBVpPvVp04M_00013 [Vibrio phage vB_Vp_PvVp04_M]|nr:coil containing protein [Vibrio phage 1.154.O._10N.222.52.B12]UOL47407.1 hypothetical protein vBVpPvVp04M_00013 [Vibrio phage vB_Vp_PvVp04_M]